MTMIRKVLAAAGRASAIGFAAAAVLLCLLAPVVGHAPRAAEQAAPFQAHLDRLGVPYRVPDEGKAILVNIPAFELVAFAEGRPVLRSRVIVGAPWHPTPLIDTYTTVVRFRPTWRPTPAMVRSGEYEDKVWPPGRRNPLGLAAIRLQPGFLVYLHDTNRRELFQRDNRALSHGCIRVQRWDELIAWLLDLDLAEVQRFANGRRTFDMPTAQVPVTLGYFTLFPDDAGNPVRHADVYARADAPPADDGQAELAAGPGCAAPGGPG
ncbi:MAG TPA: L,D-transpeptidase family protein [Thermohalobaculum sp.]|nr:L,D-transpeptidase family protein [Thermohalobaculum sp.]